MTLPHKNGREDGGAAHISQSTRSRAAELIELVETGVYILLALLLSLAALMALYEGGHALVANLSEIGRMGSPATAVRELEQLLFVLMLVEILHTVKISIESHRLVTEPFLIVAIIASVRRMLVITMESSQLVSDGKWVADGRSVFLLSLWELGLLGLLVLALVGAIIMMRRSRPSPES